MYESIISYNNLLLAWGEFRRGKSARLDILEFGLSAEKQLYALALRLSQGSWRHGEYSSFMVFEPKRRVVYKAEVIDRVLHRAIMRVLVPYFESKFVHASFASRQAKGSLAALNYLEKQLWRVSNSNTKTVWVVKLDIVKYFASIDTHRLLRTLGKHIACKKTYWLLEEIVKSYDQDCMSGLPLGNETSQLLANANLHYLDCFVLHKLKPSGYMRYMDDMLLVGTDRQQIAKFALRLREYLWQSLRLRLHWPVTPKTWESGIDTMGYVSFPYYRRLRTSTRRRGQKNDLAHKSSNASYRSLALYARERVYLRSLADTLA